MKKGISQVITSTIILAVAVAVAGVYANWAPDFAERISEKTADQQEQDTACRNAALRIESAQYDLSGNFTEVEITNTGTINLYEGLEAASIKNAGILNSTTVNQIEVDETVQFRIYSEKTPDSVLISSKDCPSNEVSTDRITKTG